jgi:uncharacterized protein
MEDILLKFNPWWDKTYEFPGIERDEYLAKLEPLLGLRDVLLITGLRRVGKTTIMHQLIHRLLQNVSPRNILYISLDYLPLRDRTILEIEEAFRKVNSLKFNEKVFLFFDEVHFHNDYELQLKNLYDLGFSKVVASGSANLDIVMRSPYLTGRQRLVRINPLSFNEFMRFRGLHVSRVDRHLLPSIALDYVETGGLPEYVLRKDPNVLQTLIDTILYRDISDRNNIRNRENVKNILMMIAQSVSTPLSVNRISRVLKIRNEIVSKIIDLLIEANLIHIAERTGKFAERKASPNKYYLADTGLFSVLTERINLGAKVENSVFLTLKRQDIVRYSKTSNEEVDFIIGTDAFEAKYKREITEKDLTPIRNLRGPTSRTIITENTEDIHKNIRLMPLWKFFQEREIL